MTKQIFYYENPKDNRIVKITLSSIEELAQETGDLRTAQSMDDESFYGYCDMIVAKGSERDN